MRYNGLMAIPTLKFAVYYGTITLDNGDVATYTANQVATFYGVQALPYTAVPLTGVNPIQAHEFEYIQLKPLSDGNYYDAQSRYNVTMQPYLDSDFDAKQGGKWVVRPHTEDTDSDYS